MLVLNNPWPTLANFAHTAPATRNAVFLSTLASLAPIISVRAAPCPAPALLLRHWPDFREVAYWLRTECAHPENLPRYAITSDTAHCVCLFEGWLPEVQALRFPERDLRAYNEDQMLQMLISRLDQGKPMIAPEMWAWLAASLGIPASKEERYYPLLVMQVGNLVKIPGVGQRVQELLDYLDAAAEWKNPLRLLVLNELHKLEKKLDAYFM